MTRSAVSSQLISVRITSGSRFVSIILLTQFEFAKKTAQGFKLCRFFDARFGLGEAKLWSCFDQGFDADFHQAARTVFGFRNFLCNLFICKVLEVWQLYDIWIPFLVEF
ncbi:unnamed protein product [Vicia faba]|uniref:Uncharacterized protein n=1 Tax=Vicia faba TaxID=3906 RepID=A0AAV1B1W1_VICFA|nr:unnamed protein product [Vicia faba]